MIGGSGIPITDSGDSDRCTYAEATASEKLHDWIGAHERMLAHFGGSTAIWVPDQLRSAIVQPCRYEPGVNTRPMQKVGANRWEPWEPRTGRRSSHGRSRGTSLGNGRSAR